VRHGVKRRNSALAPRGIRIQVDAGFVDLAAQVATFVGRQAATTALCFSVAVLLLPVAVVGPWLVTGRVVALPTAVGVFVPALGLLLLLLLAIVAAPATTILGLDCTHGAQHGPRKCANGHGTART